MAAWGLFQFTPNFTAIPAYAESMVILQARGNKAPKASESPLPFLTDSAARLGLAALCAQCVCDTQELFR
jgi:hypothetical protein